MDIDNLAHAPVFPEFIPISQFNIGKTKLVIVFQGSEIQMLVFQKIIIRGTVSSVTITEDDVKQLEKKVQDLTDKYCKEADELANAKEKEIMSV